MSILICGSAQWELILTHPAKILALADRTVPLCSEAHADAIRQHGRGRLLFAGAVIEV
jgi:hypothetical protein